MKSKAYRRISGGGGERCRIDQMDEKCVKKYRFRSFLLYFSLEGGRGVF